MGKKFPGYEFARGYQMGLRVAILVLRQRIRIDGIRGINKVVLQRVVEELTEQHDEGAAAVQEPVIANFPGMEPVCPSCGNSVAGAAWNGTTQGCQHGWHDSHQ